jgi:hypothetical protein
MQRLIVMDRAKTLQQGVLDLLKRLEQGKLPNTDNDPIMKCLKTCEVEKRRSEYKKQQENANGMVE